MKKKRIVAMVATMGMVVGSQATLLLYEGFDYAGSLSNGADLTGVSGGSGNWSGAWTNNGSAMAFSSTGLSYTDAGGRTLSATGGAVADNATGNGVVVAKRFYTPGTIGESGTLWFSMLVNYTDGAHDYVHFGGTDGTAGRDSGFGFAVGNGTVGGGIADDNLAASLSDNAGGLLNAGTTPAFTLGSTHLVVGRLSLVDGGNDTLDIWLDPELTSAYFSTNAVDSSVTAGFVSVTNLFQIGSGAAAIATYDELRLGTDVTDVIAIPEPMTLGLIGLSGIGILFARRIMM